MAVSPNIQKFQARNNPDRSAENNALFKGGDVNCEIKVIIAGKCYSLEGRWLRRNGGQKQVVSGGSARNMNVQIYRPFPSH